MDTYELKSEEKKQWVARVAPHFPRGSQRASAKKLCKVLTWGESSLNRYISEFKRGDGLDRFFVGESESELPVLVLERHLELEEGTFARYLDQVRSDPGSDGDFDIRLPGFADKGALPIEEAWLPPGQRRVQVSGGRCSQGGFLDLDLLLEELQRPRRRRTVCLLTGPRGSGRSSLLLRLARVFVDEGRVARTVDGIDASVEAVFIDDFGQLTREERRTVAEWGSWMDRTGLLVVVGEPGEPLSPLRDPDVVVELASPTALWLEKWLTHLAEIAEERWDLSVESDWLSEWFHDEPTALETAGSPDISAVLLRRGPQGGDRRFPGRLTREHVLLRALEHVTELLTLKALQQSADFMRTHGRALVSTIALATWRAGGAPPSRVDLPRLAWEAVQRSVGIRVARSELAESGGFSRVLTALTSVGFFHGSSGSLEMHPRSLLPLGLGDAITDNDQDLGEAVRAIVMEPEWHSALELVAETPGKADALIEEILGLPAPLLAEAFPALARVLCSHLAATRAELVDQAFKLCLCWWARRGRGRPSMTFTVSAGGPAVESGQPAVEGRVVGSHPLVLLGRASGQLRHLLAPIDIEEIARGDALSDGLRLFLQATDQLDLGADQALVATLIAAPFQLPLAVVLAGESLRRIVPRGLEESASPLDNGEFDAWWRVVFLPLLELVDDERRGAILSGTAPGFDIRWWMLGPHRSAEVWGDALARALLASVPESADAYALALSFTAGSIGTANEDTCRRTWKMVSGSGASSGDPERRSGAVQLLGTRLRRSEREAIADRVLELLTGPEVDSRRDSGFMQWLITNVLGPDRRDALWAAWLESDPTRMPWKAFHAAGLPSERIGQWALGVDDDEPSIAAQIAQIQRSGEGGLINLTEDERRPNQALGFFVEPSGSERPKLEDRLPVLRLVALHGSGDLQQKAISELMKQHGDQARPFRIELSSVAEAPLCFYLAPQTKPKVGESEFWAALAARAHEFWAVGALGLLARADLADAIDENLDPDEGLWPRTAAVLAVADLALMSREERAELLADADEQAPGLDLSGLELDDDGLIHLKEKLAGALGQLVLEITGKNDPLPGATALAAGIAESPRLLARIRPDGAQTRLLVMASDERGAAWMAARLVEASDGLNEGETRSLMLAALQPGREKLVVEVFEREALSLPMALVMAARLKPQAIQLLRAGIEALGFEQSSDPEKLAAGHLLRRWLSWEPSEAILTLRGGVQAHPADSRRAWWQLAVRHLEPGYLRAEAMAELLEAGSDSAV